MILVVVLFVSGAVAVFANSLPTAIPNSSFELGIVGGVPTSWTAEYIDFEGANPPALGTFHHNLEKSAAAYYDGSYSLYGRAYYRQDQFRKNNPCAWTWAHSEYVNASSATTVTMYMRSISRTKPSHWGWTSYIFLKLSDGTNQVTYQLYEWREYPQGHAYEVNHYDSIAQGADGQQWYVYTRDVPSTLDKSHIKVSIGWLADSWFWYPGGVVALSSYVDDVHFSPITATIDIDPDVLNLKGNGKWVTAYIELPEGYDGSRCTQPSQRS
jgi:hypothetical protein